MYYSCGMRLHPKILRYDPREEASPIKEPPFEGRVNKVTRRSCSRQLFRLSSGTGSCISFPSEVGAGKEIFNSHNHALGSTLQHLQGI